MPPPPRLIGAHCKRIEQLELANPEKIFHIMGDKDAPMFYRRSGNNRVAQRHPSPLPQPDRPLHYRIRHRQHLGCLEESLQKLLFYYAQTVVTKRRDVADHRDGRDMLGHKLPRGGVLNLRGVNGNIAIEELYCSRVGNERWCRNSCCLATGSMMAAKVPRLANAARASAIA